MNKVLPSQEVRHLTCYLDQNEKRRGDVTSPQKQDQPQYIDSTIAGF